MPYPSTEGFNFETGKLGDLGTFKVKGRSILVVLSHLPIWPEVEKAVKYWMEKENIPQKNVLIIQDELLIFLLETIR